MNINPELCLDMLYNAQPQGLSIEAILLLKYVHVHCKSCLFRADWSRETIPALHVPRSHHELESIKCIIIDVSLMLLFVLNLQHAEHRVVAVVCCVTTSLNEITFCHQFPVTVTTSLNERNHHTALQLSKILVSSELVHGWLEVLHMKKKTKVYAFQRS